MKTEMIILDARSEKVGERCLFKDLKRGETFELVFDDFHVCMRIDIDKAVVIDTGEVISVDLDERVEKQDCIVTVCD